MTGAHESRHNAVQWESEAEEASDSPSTGRDPKRGGQWVDDEVVEAEIVDDEDGADNGTEIVDGSSPDLNAVTIATAERDEYLDSLRRLQAEFENYKKRVAKQQTDQSARAALVLVEKMLPVLDTLDLATAHIGDPESADGRALLAASSQLHDVLSKEGLERIDPMGDEFDPNTHEAVGHVPSDEGVDPMAGGSGGERSRGEAAPGAATGEPVVAQVMRPGYRWRGAVVRPAMVMVRG